MRAETKRDDTETDLLLQDHFDFIHARNITHSVKKWSTVLEEVIRLASPFTVLLLFHGQH